MEQIKSIACVLITIAIMSVFVNVAQKLGFSVTNLTLAVSCWVVLTMVSVTIATFSVAAIDVFVLKNKTDNR